jgi:TRAP-type uncharacterized transport system substrate-binding protein
MSAGGQSGDVMSNTIARLCCIVAVSLTAFSALAQAPALKAPTPSSEADFRAKRNAWTIGLESGQLEGLYPRLASDIQRVLDDGDNLRVLPMLAYGASSNLEDLLYLRGVDVAFTQSDVFEYFRTQRKIPNLQQRVHYIMRLYNTELHVLARPEIKTFEDLRGKMVSFGPPGNSATLTGPIIFQRLGIEHQPLLLDHTSGLEQLKRGDISAVVRVVGKPIDQLAKIPPGSGLHFLAIPGMKLFDDIYTIGELGNKDYPTLIAPGETVETIAVPTVLAAYNWPKSNDHYRRLERFTRQMFAKWDRFLVEPSSPKWREVNPAASVPGWSRFSVADELVKSPASVDADGSGASAEFETFVVQRGGKAVRT